MSLIKVEREMSNTVSVLVIVKPAEFQLLLLDL